MKQFYFLRGLLPTLFVLLMSFGAIAQETQEYRGRCLTFDPKDEKEEFHSCTMTLTDKTIETVFKNEIYQPRAIPARSITQIASGNYAKRLLTDTGSIATSILLGPLSIANRIISRDYQQYILRYSEAGVPSVAVLLVKRSQAPEFQQNLRLLVRDMTVEFQDPEDNTILDVGPDID